MPGTRSSRFDSTCSAFTRNVLCSLNFKPAQESGVSYSGAFGLVKSFGFEAPLWLVMAFAFAADFAFSSRIFDD